MTIMLDGELTAEEMDAIFGMTEEKEEVKPVEKVSEEVEQDATDLARVARKYGERRAEETRRTKDVEDFCSDLNLNDPVELALYNAKWSELGL